MTIARQFYLQTIVAFLLVLTFAAVVTYRFAGLSAAGTQQIENLEHTEALNQELASGNRDQGEQLRNQLERVDRSFPLRFRQLDYALGQRYTEYLRLDIGEGERLTVERIRALQSELSIVSMHIYELLRSGDRARANTRLHDLARLESQIRDEFERLNSLQLTKLHTVLTHLDETVTMTIQAVVGLGALLILVMGVTAWMMHRRVLGPVRGLLAASGRIRVGDFSARAPDSGAAELAQLAHGFNFMAQSLAESYASLEQKVEERTRQIEQMQRQLVQAEKMSAVGVLVSGVAHELNNPLAAIAGLTELAKADPHDAAPSRTTLDDIDAQVERCRRIVLNLLQFARKQEPRMEVVALNDLVDQMLQLREYELSTRNMTLVRDFDPGNPLLRADPNQIQQVALNLLNNAHDAIKDAGHPGTIWVRTRADNAHVSLEFLDDGPGFEDATRVFDPFYTTKQVGEGTGLGLSVCYGIVQEHRGSIVVANWEKGARVAVTLPIGDVSSPPIRMATAPVPAPAAGKQPSRRSRPRALVVDDEALLVKLQTQYLAKMGIDAVGVRTGEEGRRHLEGREVDLIVSDVRMPGTVDGVQLYRWVETHRPQLARHFVFVSGDLVGLNLDEFFETTGAPRIAKPFRFDAYASVIRQVVPS